ncbi:MAG: AEC family transporter [Pseudomonadota bacterium]
MLAVQIVQIVFPLFFIAAVGAVYAFKYRPDMAVANATNMNIFVPALAFTALVESDADLASFQPLILGATVVVLGSGLIAWGIARVFEFDIKTFVPPMMFSNSGNMGLPLLTLTFGPAALPTATILLLVENTLHFTLGSYMLNKHASLVKHLFSPLIIATVLALIINAIDMTVNPTVMRPIEMLGQVSIPLMLFSLGTRLADANLGEWKIGLVSAVASPVCGIALALMVLPWIELSDMQIGALILFGSLPPAVLNFLFAERYQQEPKKVASIVIFSHLFTLISLPLTLAYVLPRYS